MNVKVTFNDGEIAALTSKLKALSAVKFDRVCKKSLSEIYNRAKNGGTPWRTGELTRWSSASTAEMEFGYIKDYAPHVEYGHRTVGGGYVEGQRYLQKNVEAQQEVFKNDLKGAITGA